MMSFFNGANREIEMYEYDVIEKYSGFEIREYKSSLFTKVNLHSTHYDDVSKKGFRILAGYIFGENESHTKIDMTSPVAMAINDSISMMFMVPHNLKKEDLPKPENQEIYFIEEPEKIVAAITFDGWANDTRINNYTDILIQKLEAHDIKYKNKFYFLGYNPPYELINRRNEIIIELLKEE